MPDPVVVEVPKFGSLPVGANGSRRAVVRWSDGTTGEALRRFDHEILFSEGDLSARPKPSSATLHFRRDRDHPQSDG